MRLSLSRDLQKAVLRLERYGVLQHCLSRLKHSTVTWRKVRPRPPQYLVHVHLSPPLVNLTKLNFYHKLMQKRDKLVRENSPESRKLSV